MANQIKQKKQQTQNVKSSAKTEKASVQAEKRTLKRAADKSAGTIVTKDTNIVELDSSVFDDNYVHNAGQKPEQAFTYTQKSVTIDRSLLSKEHIQKRGKRRKNLKTVDLTQAERINADHTMGLNSAQVQQRFENGYDNFVAKKGGKSYLQILINNIFTFFNMLTFGVAIALMVVGAGFTQLFFILIISANILIGLFQEVRSKFIVDRLTLITAPTAFVVRNGERRSLPVSDVVLDDIIYLETGKQICADSILIQGDCEVNESMLTGESEPVRKTKGSILYAGSFVSAGNCHARVDKVGSHNYVETLSSYAKRYKKPKSELMNSIKLIIKVITPIIIIVGALMVYIAYRKIYNTNGVVLWRKDWYDIISSASGSIIGMIPAGMFLLTSIALFVSVMRLAAKRTLVQDLYCIEMLARVNVLCLDKTGTITDGSMQVNNVIEIKGYEGEYQIPEIIGSMLNATGDNNQTALALANKFGYSKLLTPAIVLPFSSQRKLSAVTFEGDAGTYMLGAPEFVLKEMGVRIEKIINENAANGYRIMVLAHSPSAINGDKLPAVRRPICLIVIEDHIRADAYETIRWFKENNVAVKVISGDNPITVSEVAKRVGVEKGELYISLDGFSNQEVIEAANKYTVFGRVTPEQKSLLIKALKAGGNTVAMTGDGVNDILAMREADCSISIASGAEAARNVSHLVLLNNDFTSMPDVVMEGRRVVNNVQKSSTMFLMKTFMSIVLSIIFLAMGDPYPLNTSNLLPLEICVIGIPTFFLALQSNKNIIRGKFLTNVISRAVPGGLALVLNVMAIFSYQQFLNIAQPEYICMLVIAITFTGLMILFKQCEPFNPFRVVLILGTIAMIFAMVFIINDIGIVALELREIFFTITLILASYFIISICMKLSSMIKIE